MAMHVRQQHHIDHVIHTIHGGGLPVVDSLIAASWRRSVLQYGHNPTQLQAAKILPQASFQTFLDPYDEFIAITRHGLQALYRQIKDMGYVVLLSDNHGVVVAAQGTEQQPKALARAGLCRSAQWREADNGTSAMGLALATGCGVTVHQTEHFDATHLDLTCSAAPIFDSHGALYAVLNVSALRSNVAKSSQFLVLQMVKRYARLIENAGFIHTHRRHWLIKLAVAPEFLEVDAEYLLAVDDNGQICGANQGLRQWLAEQPGLPESRLPGPALESLLGVDLHRLLAQHRDSAGCLPVSIGNGILYAKVQPPAAALVSPAAAAIALPEALDALCAPTSRLRTALHKIAHLADTPVPMLLNGETGSGKEVLARAVHQSGRRSKKPFIAINCAAIAESLIESELYGYAPGSFSGASGKGKTGLIQAADGGTLFLDEIGDMPLFLQSRLLRVLSEREVLPVGSTRAIKVDIRIIAATHCDLQQKITEGKFREDLYYRLNGLHFVIPPLRERDDIPYLAQHILQQCARQLGVSAKPLSAEALALIQCQRWPGNLRQLKSVLEVALLTARGRCIEADNLPEDWQHSAINAAADAALPDTRQILDCPQLLHQTLQQHQWRITALARSLNISRMTLYRYMEKHGIRKPD